MKTLGEKVKDRRVDLGLTQQELANQTGIALKTLANIEVRGAIPRSTTLRKLCTVLGVSEMYLTNDEITDSSYGLEEAPYVDSIREQYGKPAADGMAEVLEKSRMFFAGGEVPQEDKDAFFAAIASAYAMCKEDAKATFTPKKYRR